MRKFIIPALLFGALLYISTSKVIDGVKLELRDLYSKQLTAEKWNAGAKVAITNPLPVDITVKKFLADVFYKNVKISSIRITKNAEIKASGETTLNVPFSIPLKNLSNVLINIINQGAAPEIRIKGRVDFNKGNVPFDFIQSLSA